MERFLPRFLAYLHVSLHNGLSAFMDALAVKDVASGMSSVIGHLRPSGESSLDSLRCHSRHRDGQGRLWVATDNVCPA